MYRSCMNCPKLHNPIGENAKIKKRNLYAIYYYYISKNYFYSSSLLKNKIPNEEIYYNSSDDLFCYDSALFLFTKEN